MTKEQLENLSLNELYRYATGNVKSDIEQILSDAQSLEEDEKLSLLGRLIATIPGGQGMGTVASMLKEQIYEAIGGVVADVDGDGDVDQDDFDAVKADKLDMNGDEEFTEADLKLVKALSTAHIVDTLDEDEEEDLEDLGE